MRLLWVGLLASLVCIACGPGGGGGSDGGLRDGGAGSGSAGSGGAPAVANPNAPVDDDAIGQYARQNCEAYERCGPDIYPDFETCVDASICSLGNLLMGTALTRGQLLGCSGALASIPCGSMITTLPNMCVSLITAIADALGEEAGCDGELCAEGMYCNRKDDHCPFCAPYAKVGEPCLDTRCVRGAYCSTDTLNCELEKSEGMPCEGFNECKHSAYGSKEWLTCRDGVCARPVESGGACEQGTDCVAFLLCEGGVCTERGRVGDACTDRQDCYPYATCIGGTCTATCGFQREGGPCLDDVYCRESYCDEATSACVATRPAGAPCARKAECGDGAFCNAATTLCAVQLADGAPCTSDDECASGLCNEQQCHQPVCMN